MKSHGGIVLCLAMLATICSIAPLRAQLNRGVLEGIVSDPQDAAVPNVDVTITNLETSVAVKTKTNGSGYYHAEDLVPGKHTAHFEYSGFAAMDIANIQIPAGQLIRVDAQMKVGTSLQRVEVSAQTALLETAATNASTTIETRTVEQLPLAGRTPPVG